MLKTRTISLSTIVLISVAVILVAALAMAAYLKITPSAPSVSLPPANPAIENLVPAPVSANPVAARSVYVSEQTLRSRLDEAYERGQDRLAQTLLRILNGRYEHRCCGLPR